jgi:phosphatidylserine/phosphatidylglycerophosphate/cardiolipin synthase-like enzyme
VEPFVDGTEALPRIADAIRSAKSHVHLAGWHFDPSFRLEQDGPALRELLAEAAERIDVRVLAWAGAPLPLFHPARSEVRQARDRLAGGTRISMALDARERPFHCHHEKLVVVDDEAAFVGGIDLTGLAGDRLDSSDHPPRDGLGWHDTAVRLEGPIVADVARHFHVRWHAVAEDGTQHAPEPNGSAVPDGIEAHFVRTVPERLYEPIRDGEWSILESYLRALRGAERLVYIESQFLWSPEIAFVLADKLRHPPCDDFRVIAVLPSRPNNGTDDSRGQVGLLIDADKECDDTTRFLACTLYQPGPGGNPVYVHSKAAVVDDEWLTIGSANLNEHSLFNDTEANVVVRDPSLAREVRLRLWEEHLERPRREIDGDPARVFDEVWKPLADERLERRRRDGWADGKLTLLPHVSRRSEALWGPLNGLLVDG